MVSLGHGSFPTISVATWLDLQCVRSTLPVLGGLHGNILHTGWLKPQKLISYSSGGWKCKIKVWTISVSGGSCLLGFLQCPHGVERESKLPGIADIMRTQIWLLDQGSTLKTSLNLNYFLIQIQPHWKLGLHIYIFGGVGAQFGPSTASSTAGFHRVQEHSTSCPRCSLSFQEPSSLPREFNCNPGQFPVDFRGHFMGEFLFVSSGFWHPINYQPSGGL